MTHAATENQVAPFRLETPDGKKLFGWHVLPLDAYEKNRARLCSIELSEEDIDNNELAKIHMGILHDDPDAHVIISYLRHGNGGCLSTLHRPDVYRALISTSPEHTHVFAIDYRDYGMSTDVPSETDLIADSAFASLAITKMTGIPPSETVLVGQSLGTGVIVGIVDQLAQADPPVEFKAIVLISAFASIEKVVVSFWPRGLFPILGSISYLPLAQDFVSKFIRYAFRSEERIENFVRNTRKTKVLIVSSFQDAEIPFFHGENLLEAALRGTLSTILEENDESDGLVHLNKYLGMAEDERSGLFEVVSIAEQQSREYHFYQRFPGTRALVEEDQSSENETAEVAAVKAIVQEVMTATNDEEVRRISMLAVKWGGHNDVAKASDVIFAIRELLYE